MKQEDPKPPDKLEDSIPAGKQTDPAPEKMAEPKPDPEDRKLEIEREKLVIEREKLKIEFEKLRVERWKARSTVASIGIPLVVVALTVWVGYQSERTRAETEFNLKAAEIIMAHQNPFEMKGRARILKAIFPQRLPADFGENFSEREYAVPLPANSELLLRLLIEHPDQRAEIIRMWRVAYPDESWVEALNPPPAR